MASPRERAKMSPQERGFQPIKPPSVAAEQVAAATDRMKPPELSKQEESLARKLGMNALEVMWARRRYAVLRTQDLALLRHRLNRGDLVDHLVSVGRSAMLMAHRLTRASVKADELEREVETRWIMSGNEAPDALSPPEQQAFTKELEQWEQSDVGRLFAGAAPSLAPAADPRQE